MVETKPWNLTSQLRHFEEKGYEMRSFDAIRALKLANQELAVTIELQVANTLLAGEGQRGKQSAVLGDIVCRPPEKSTDLRNRAVKLEYDAETCLPGIATGSSIDPSTRP